MRFLIQAYFLSILKKLKVCQKKTQGTFWTKNSREWSQLGILAKKTQGKLTFMGSFLEEWQDFGHFYYQLITFWANIAFISSKTNHLKKTQGFCKKKLKDSAKKTQPFGVKWLGKTPKSRSKNKPGLFDRHAFPRGKSA